MSVKLLYLTKFTFHLSKPSAMVPSLIHLIRPSIVSLLLQRSMQPGPAWGTSAPFP